MINLDKIFYNCSSLKKNEIKKFLLNNKIDDINDNNSSLKNERVNHLNDDIKETYKIILGGDTYSGKTSFIKRIEGEKFDEQEGTTIGPQYRRIKRYFENILISLDFWDTTCWGDKYDELIKHIKVYSNELFLLFDLNIKVVFKI